MRFSSSSSSSSSFTIEELLRQDSDDEDDEELNRLLHLKQHPHKPHAPSSSSSSSVQGPPSDQVGGADLPDRETFSRQAGRDPVLEEGAEGGEEGAEAARGRSLSSSRRSPSHRETDARRSETNAAVPVKPINHGEHFESQRRYRGEGNGEEGGDDRPCASSPSPLPLSSLYSRSSPHPSPLQPNGALQPSEQTSLSRVGRRKDSADEGEGGGGRETRRRDDAGHRWNVSNKPPKTVEEILRDVEEEEEEEEEQWLK